MANIKLVRFTCDSISKSALGHSPLAAVAVSNSVMTAITIGGQTKA